MTVKNTNYEKVSINLIKTIFIIKNLIDIFDLGCRIISLIETICQLNNLNIKLLQKKVLEIY